MKTSLLLMLVLLCAVAMAAPQLGAAGGAPQGTRGTQANLAPRANILPQYYFAFDDDLYDRDYYHVIRGADGQNYYIELD